MENPYYVGLDTDWPEAYFAIFANDEDGTPVEFVGKILYRGLAWMIADLLNISVAATGVGPAFPLKEEVDENPNMPKIWGEVAVTPPEKKADSNPNMPKSWSGGAVAFPK